MKRFIPIRIGSGRFSFLLDTKAAIVIGLLGITAFFAVVISVGVGDFYIPPLDVISVFMGSGSDMHTLVIEKLRLPRILIALMSGAALAVSGAILQGVVRNPLAAPDILGITGGASVAAVSVITFFSDSTDSLSVSVNWIPAAAFAGATVVAALIYLLSWKNGVSPFRLVLIGIGFYTATQAATNLIILLGPVFRAVQSKTWLTGSVYGSTWEYVFTLLPWVGILIPVAILLAPNVNVQQFGDHLARGLGSKLQSQRLVLLLISTGLAGSAVAFAGGISFVGLIAPHAARRLVGSSFGALLPASALLGATIVMLADLLGRTLVPATEIPAGVFTAVIGAPYFIYLLFRSRRR
ncbi:FecCD family ABC transporter permease [Paenactinomyces guangxiensis]|uniref:Iron ABC transporter permease n=1 Tax=Paenactinomyces guangxiensis TaxID=1490290 RepID=A0A7W1WPK0_9BACL|nr:iron ABC transporter permease [Paenactinomyces guangxiensis]MBA4493701.1 iron ABC transporter permease [Paenactinomyces guangxiensis]MBH8590988.1 iron ABC transporter permease [Paenactinomyces guangxiensis]